MTNDERRMTEGNDLSSSVIRPSSVLWVGSVGGMEADLVRRAGIPFEAIPAAGVHGVGIRSLPGNLRQLGRGFFAARRILRQFRPDVLFFTGGYIAVPVALAVRTLPAPRPRMVVFVPDIEPGLALKVLGRFADRIALSVDDSGAYFSPAAGRKLAITGYPVRAELEASCVSPDGQEDARLALGLSAGLPTLLVVGGSSGARSINRALLPVLAELLSEAQVIHLTGKLDWAEVEAAQKGLSPVLASRYHAYPYLHSERMGTALRAADLALARAGASILGEFPLFGIPAVLVPYPYAWRYQSVNAGYLAKRGAALIVKDADLPSQILPIVRRLIHDAASLESMRSAMRSLARPQAARNIAGLLEDLASTAASAGGGE
jgi:UDP-N-acetylglucosamine--N-acetylmuramyl-(pentapeptide) pyrophosphoryl-undecaprenol N-acetylglucosamine transferase